MLLGFRTANHRSLRQEQRLTLTPVYGADRESDDDRPAVPVAAIFGPNAAGKSNVLHALRFMRQMVTNSHRDAEPGGGIAREPFALDPDCLIEPSWYVVDLLLEGIRHTYGFSIDGSRVLDEWLYSYPLGRRRKVFQRSADGPTTYGEATDKSAMELVDSITEPNVLLLSVAARSRQTAVLPVYDWFQGDLQVRLGAGGGPAARLATMQMMEDPESCQVVNELLAAADLGIQRAGVERVVAGEGISTEELQVRAAELQRSLAVAEAEQMFERERWAATGNPAEAGEWSDRIRQSNARIASVSAELRAVSQLANQALRRTQAHFWFEQRGRKDTVRLGLGEQSQGTRVLLDLAGPALTALRRGGLLVVDEVDSSLHPRLTARLIGLFQDVRSNPHGAQLLLSTHDATLLGRLDGEEVLKRDQIWFVEKDAYGESVLFPLSDFKPRPGENRERRYLGGSYGAVPLLSDDRFLEALSGREAAGDGVEPGEQEG